MKKILNEFNQAGALEKLGVIANLATIFGVSVATFVAGPFLSEITGVGFDASEFVVALLFYFTFFLLFVGVLFIFWFSLKGLFYKNYGKATGYILLALLSSSIYLNLVPWLSEGLGDLTDNRYMMPEPANMVVVDFSNISIEAGENRFSVNGKVDFRSNALISDYGVALYGFNERSNAYTLHDFKYDELFEINDDGVFKIPSQEGDFNFSDSYIVVFRRADQEGAQDKLPNYLTLIPNIELSQIGAYIHKLEYTANKSSKKDAVIGASS